VIGAEVIMKLIVTATQDRPLTVVFEPVAEEFTIPPGDHILVEWDAAEGPAEICPESDHLMIGSPMKGTMRAWRSDGTEIPIF
jgi:hypothetical protein